MRKPIKTNEVSTSLLVIKLASHVGQLDQLFGYQVGVIYERHFSDFFPMVSGYRESTFLSNKVIPYNSLSQLPLAVFAGNGHIQDLEPFNGN